MLEPKRELMQRGSLTLHEHVAGFLLWSEGEPAHANSLEKR